MLYRQALRSDVGYVADNMRKEDQEECLAGGLNPYDALSTSFTNCPFCYTLVNPVNFKPSGILGVSDSPLGPAFGIIWMLGTDDIAKHKFAFLRKCTQGVNDLFTVSQKECLYNYSYSQNDLHHAWLKWLGFKFLREVRMPPHGNSFLEFVRLKG